MFTLQLGCAKKNLEFTPIPENPLGGFVYFNMNNNDMTDFISEGTRLIDDTCKRFGGPNKVVLFTAETSTLAIAHMLRFMCGYEVHVMCKKRRPDGKDVVFEEYCAITSTVPSTLYFDAGWKCPAGKKIVFFDNVCTTGETVRAAAKVLMKLGYRIDRAIMLFTEGEQRNEVAVANDYVIPLISYGHLPIVDLEISTVKPQFIFKSETILPTYNYGSLKLAVFTSYTNKDAIVAYNNSLDCITKGDKVLLRVHDACATSELFHSEKCDCREQLEASLKKISMEGGMVIYLPQEGRGIGLANKLMAYNLQETKGMNTVDANVALGFPQDVRNYIAVKDILQHYGVKSIRLLSNNPRKKEELEKVGVDVAEMAPIVIQTNSSLCQKYLTDKALLMNHTMPIIKFYDPDSEFGYLSNFYKCDLKCSVYLDIYDEKDCVGSSEHLYQASKFLDNNIKEEILSASSPKEAFELSRKYASFVRYDWESIKIQSMKYAIQQKFKKYDMRLLLLGTEDAILVEDSPTDPFWGLPQNNLGRLLMEVRSELRSDHMNELYNEVLE